MKMETQNSQNKVGKEVQNLEDLNFSIWKFTTLGIMKMFCRWIVVIIIQQCQVYLTVHFKIVNMADFYVYITTINLLQIYSSFHCGGAIKIEV